MDPTHLPHFADIREQIQDFFSFILHMLVEESKSFVIF